ncbi:lymphotoxin-alpha [Syngnathus acus]|uniref:lymphotoxin-alpha n=1 Tax=Syngnathus acus TaxID=161584 RepID=UPI001885CAB5|nr:lymphotoxin-alpha [Syngnathus acus]XP_037129702.1 lymphotoxin-alpha [Syngnathus acus]
MDSRPWSMKKVLLQVWLTFLTVAVLLVGALLGYFIKQVAFVELREGTTLSGGNNFNPTRASLMSVGVFPGSSHSYIQIMKPSKGQPWESSLPTCDQCSLELRDDSIQFGRDGVYFLYAQVTFTEQSGSGEQRVIVTKNATSGKSIRKLAEGYYPAGTSHGSVWLAKMVRLREGDSVSVNISGDFLTDDTFWGAFQIH